VLLELFFKKNPRFAVAFSGGVDSSYLLYAANAAGCDVCAYFIKTEFQPAFELEDAKQITNQLGIRLVINEYSIINEPDITSNPPDRCYHCKTKIFTGIRKLALADGYDILCDGTNADDDETDRPGMRALRELGVLSPLKICGLDKKTIRKLSAQAQLATHDKPAYACLATRIPAGTTITKELVSKIEHAENILFDMGFSDIRVRLLPPDTAKIQVTGRQWEKAAAQHSKIYEALKNTFGSIVLDLAER